MNNDFNKNGVANTENGTEVLVAGYAEKLETLTLLEHAIDACANSAVQKNIDIAGIIGKISDRGLWKLNGASGIGEYAEKRFGIKKAQTSAMCKVASVFLAENGADSNEYVVCLPITANCAWNVTQLCELARCGKETDEIKTNAQALFDSGAVNSTMSAKEIREAVHALTDKEKEKKSGDSEEAKAKNADKKAQKEAQAEAVKTAIENALNEVALRVCDLLNLVRKADTDKAVTLAEAVNGSLNYVRQTLGIADTSTAPNTTEEEEEEEEEEAE